MSEVVVWVVTEVLGKVSVVWVLMLPMYLDLGFQIELFSLVEADPN